MAEVTTASEAHQVFTSTDWSSGAASRRSGRSFSNDPAQDHCGSFVWGAALGRPQIAQALVREKLDPRELDVRATGSQDLPSTSWSLLESARRTGAEGERARAEFASRYLGPVQAYLAALCGQAEWARDLAQDFFADRVLAGKLIDKADAQRGAFRPYLKRAVRNFFVDEARRHASLKRGGAARPVGTEGIENVAQTGGENPEAVFHREWVRMLLRDVIRRVRQRCEERGQQTHFEVFRRRYLDETGAVPSWADIGQVCGLDERSARSRAETAVRHFRDLLYEALSNEMESPEAARQEIATLLSIGR